MKVWVIIFFQFHRVIKKTQLQFLPEDANNFNQLLGREMVGLAALKAVTFSKHIRMFSSLVN